MTDLAFSCPEDITSMPKTSCGFFCTGCKKEVVDFRNFSDNEIQKYSEENKEKVCGVFNSNQLISPVKSNISTIFRIAFAAIFILGINTTQLFAQDTTTAITNTAISDSTFFLQGQVFDVDSIPMPFTKVYIVADNIKFGCITDIDGKYKLEVSEKFIGKSFNLVAGFVDYGLHAIHFNNFQKNDFDITHDFYLKPNSTMLSVGIIVVGTIPLISMDPYDAGRTTITGEEIRRMP